MEQLSGGCHCGNLRVEVVLSRQSGTYQPRACDCDFCRKHGAAYISDPEGSLVVRVKQMEHRGSYRQGSGQADLIYCRLCGVLIGALYKDADLIYATLNSRVIDAPIVFAAEQFASPKTLSGEQKATRWREIWFRDVSVLVP